MYGPKVNGAGNNPLNSACTLRSPQVYGRNIRKNTTGKSSESEEGHSAVVTVKGFGIACPLRHMIVQHGMVWRREFSGPPIPLFLFFFFSILPGDAEHFHTPPSENSEGNALLFYVKLKPPLTAQLSPRNARTPTATLIEELGQASKRQCFEIDLSPLL